MRYFPFLLLLTGVAGLAGCGWPNDPLQKETEQFFSCSREVRLSLQENDGSIHIYGWAEPRVRLAALRRAYSAARLRQIQVEVKATAETIAVRTLIPPARGLFADRSGKVDFSITVPETAQLRKLELGNGEIILQGLRGGSAELELTNGRITILNSYGHVSARTLHGYTELFFDWWEKLPGTYDLALKLGRMAVRLPPSAGVTVDAATSNGRIGNGFGWPALTSKGAGEALRARNGAETTVSILLRTGGGNIDLQPVR